MAREEFDAMNPIRPERTDDVHKKLMAELEHAKRANAALPEAEKVMLERTRKVEQALGYVPPDAPAEKPDDVVERCRGDQKAANDILQEIDRLVGTEDTEFADLPGIVERTRNKCEELQANLRRAHEKIAALEKVAEAAGCSDLVLDLSTPKRAHAAEALWSALDAAQPKDSGEPAGAREQPASEDSPAGSSSLSPDTQA